MTIKNVKNLIGDTFRSYQANAVADPDMAKMYAEDHSTIQSVARYLETGDLEDVRRAAEIIDRMDTAPREEIVIAIGKDFGADWVEQYLGWNIHGWV